jgi:hypothetical protein
MFNNVFPESRAVYELMWKIVVEVGRPQMKICCMCIAFSIPKATFTHLEHAVIIAFPLQQCLHERASMLRYTCIARRVISVAFLLYICNFHQEK